MGANEETLGDVVDDVATVQDAAEQILAAVARMEHREGKVRAYTAAHAGDVTRLTRELAEARALIQTMQAQLDQHREWLATSEHHRAAQEMELATYARDLAATTQEREDARAGFAHALRVVQGFADGAAMPEAREAARAILDAIRAGGTR